MQDGELLLQGAKTLPTALTTSSGLHRTLSPTHDDLLLPGSATGSTDALLRATSAHSRPLSHIGSDRLHVARPAADSLAALGMSHIGSDRLHVARPAADSLAALGMSRRSLEHPPAGLPVRGGDQRHSVDRRRPASFDVRPRAPVSATCSAAVASVADRLAVGTLSPLTAAMAIGNDGRCGMQDSLAMLARLSITVRSSLTWRVWCRDTPGVLP